MSDVQEHLPRVWMMLHAIADPIAAIGKDRFSVAGPWTVEDWRGWLEQGGGRGIRVAVTAGADPFDRWLLDRLPDLEAIVAFGAGHEGVDLVTARARGIRINTGGATHSGDVADHAVGMILAARRPLFEADRHVREGRWPQARLRPSRSLASARVGVAGLGNIGRDVAERLVPFGCELRWWGPNAKPEVTWSRMDTLLALGTWCDVLVIAVYAHDTTRGIVTREIIEAVGPEGLIVNVSRGFVIDEPALIAALRSGRLGQYATDVFEPEPNDGAAWRALPNTILSPHCAGETVESFVALCHGAVDRVCGELASPS